MRQLIYVPIVHTIADLGSRRDSLKQDFIREFGAELWAKSCEVIEEVWDGISAKLLSLPLPWERVRIYQDGLPVSGRELEIAGEVAAQESRNYRLVLELVQRGGTLMGTESPALLRREYTYIERIAQAETETEREEAKRSYEAESAEILGARDAFIAKRIAETLKEGEVGIIFLGLLHQVDRLLPEDIELEYLIDRLPLWVVRSGPHAA